MPETKTSNRVATVLFLLIGAVLAILIVRWIGGGDEDRTTDGAALSSLLVSGVVLVPVDADTLESGPRYPYPTDESMKALTPAQRRLVYEYFDRLNADGRGDRP